MTTQEGNNAVVARHLEALANAAKEYTLAELANISVSGESCTLPTASTTTKGGVKIGSGLQMDGDTLNVTLQAGSAGGGIRVLDTVPATVDGGLWYEMFNDKPVLKIRKGDYNYVFEHSRIQRATANEYLVAWLRFNQSTTFDECGNTWTANSDAATISTDNAIFGKALTGDKITLTTPIMLGGQDFTVDFWFRALTNNWQHVFMACNNESQSTGAGGLFGVEQQTDGSIAVYTAAGVNTAALISSSNSMTHYAFVYQHSAQTMKVYKNGILVVTKTGVTINRTAHTANMGSKSPFAVDEFRVYDGLAYWTSDFTPPTAADYA